MKKNPMESVGDSDRGKAVLDMSKNELVAYVRELRMDLVKAKTEMREQRSRANREEERALAWEKRFDAMLRAIGPAMGPFSLPYR